MLILLSGCGKTASPGETVVPHASDASSSVNDPKHPGLVPRDDYGKIFPYVGRLKKSARTPVKIQSFWDGRDSLLYGFIDQNGNIICEPFYDDVELLTYGNKYAYLLTYSTGEPDYTTCYAIAGADGSFVYEYSATEFDYYSFFDGVSLHSKPSELYYKETDAYEYIPVVKDGKWGVIDYDGKQILPYSYINAPLFNEGLAAVMENDGDSYYYINSSGAKVLGPYSSTLDFFYNNQKSLVFYRGRALYYYGGWGLIDKSGRRITEGQYMTCSGFKYADTSIVREIAPYGNGESAAIHSAIIDLDGNLLTPFMLGEMHYNSDGFYVLSGGMRPNVYEEEFYYQDGTEMPYSSTYKYDGDGYFVSLNGGDRIYDKIIGEIVSAPGYGREFEIFEVYGTESGDLRLYGIKKKNGEVLVDAVFNYLTEIGVNYLAVQGDYGGLIDVNGNWIIKVTILDDSTASEHREKDPKTDYEYTIENNEATISKYIGEGTTLVIPSEIDGIKVTSIGEDAFRGCAGFLCDIPESK
ncbi:MAG TPA: WG repeat-containing protein [Thermoclostridium sp.]|nr:WG repeat-containing protein [Thermoclostridium sp.]